jgi:ABC-type glycerol-3-phosphate transport system substrate-binding protein
MRRICDCLIRLFAILSLVMVAGCSTAKSPGPTQASRPEAIPSPSVTATRPSATAARASDTPSNATPDVNAGNVTITFADLSMDFDWMDYQPLVKAFHQQNPTITVKVVPFDHTVQLNMEDYAKQADVVYLDGLNPAWLPNFLSLQPLLDATTDFNPKDYWPGSFTECENDQGVPYGVPLILEPQGVYYDPQAFDAAKVPYPKPGWTWDQFQQTINQVGTTANGTTTYGLVDGPAGSILDLLLQQHLLANDGKLDAKALAAGLAWYIQLAKAQKLYAPQPANSSGVMSFGDMSNLLQYHQAAMWIDSTSSAGYNPHYNGVYVPYPVEAQNDHTTPVWATCAAISAGTRSPQAAWAWLEFLSKQDLSGTVNTNDPHYLNAYNLSGRQSVTQKSIFWTRLDDAQRNTLQFALEHAYYYPISAYAWGMTNWNAEQAILNAIKNGTDLAAGLEGVAAAASVAIQATPTPTAGPVVLNTAPVPTTTTLPEGVTAINFNENAIMTMDPAYTYNGSAIQALVTAFEKLHPEIKVVLTGDVSAPADGDYVHALAQSNDCFETEGPGLTNYLSASDLLDLTPFLDADPTMKADFYPAFLLPYQKEGKFYGLPADTYLVYIAYNADLLTKLGVPLPKDGWTVDDLLSIAGQAADPGATPPIYGFGNGGQIFYTLNVPWYDASVKPPKAAFNTDAMAKALSWMQPLYQNGTLYETIYYKFTAYLDMIVKGQVALWGTSGTTNYNTDPWDAAKHPIFDQNLPFKVGYAPLPLLKSGSAVSTPPAGVGYFISSHASQAKAAACWAWIQYLSGQPSVFGGYSPRQSVLPKEDVGKDPARFAAVQAAIQEYNTEAEAYRNDPLMWAYNDILAQTFQAVFNGGNVAAVLAKAQSEADAYLACISQKDLTGLNSAQVFMVVQSCYVIPTPPPTTPQP